VRKLEILQTIIFVELTPILPENLFTIILFSLKYTAFSWKHKIVILENNYLALNDVGYVLFAQNQKY